ncbi:MAG: hypothetical protein U0586_06505 [Candidatus Brocadiaceae bacterium]
MQKVVSNSSPIIHLAKIGKLELLKESGFWLDNYLEARFLMEANE